MVAGRTWVVAAADSGDGLTDTASTPASVDVLEAPSADAASSGSSDAVAERAVLAHVVVFDGLRGFLLFLWIGQHGCSPTRR